MDRPIMKATLVLIQPISRQTTSSTRKAMSKYSTPRPTFSTGSLFWNMPDFTSANSSSGMPQPRFFSMGPTMKQEAYSSTMPMIWVGSRAVHSSRASTPVEADTRARAEVQGSMFSTPDTRATYSSRTMGLIRIFLNRGSMVGTVISHVVAPEPSRWAMEHKTQVISKIMVTLLPMYRMALDTMRSNMPASPSTLKNTTAKVNRAAVFRVLLRPVPR